ncbi:Uncharacterized protein FWK35_00018127 [Aphis craccivora]|uniref:Uncharacterized protein n=1 Tax=Aphis craccivora TaxID=307492 RepID=A0A6G0YFE6_APHCR|nr:Uncharacterized protein FWK35_00018127 [Aphis craccivora]
MFCSFINKSKGQTMSFCGLDLGTTCFHTNNITILHVAYSRVGKQSSLLVLAKDGLTPKISYTPLH